MAPEMAHDKTPAGHGRPGRKTGRSLVETVRASLPMLRFWEADDRFSVFALIAANVLPIVGVLLWGWDAGALVFLYWTENVVIGFYNILKMAIARGRDPDGTPKWFIIRYPSSRTRSVAASTRR